MVVMLGMVVMSEVVEKSIPMLAATYYLETMHRPDVSAKIGESYVGCAQFWCSAAS